MKTENINDTNKENKNEVNKKQDENENIEQAAVSAASGFGKFESAEKMYLSYKSLEKEFTKRCQKIKELETLLSNLQSDNIKKQSADNKDLANDLAANEKLSSGKTVYADKAIDTNLSEGDAEKIIASFLESVHSSNKRFAPLLGSSVGKSVITPAKKPKTLLDAKKLADKYFNESF